MDAYLVAHSPIQPNYGQPHITTESHHKLVCHMDYIRHLSPSKATDVIYQLSYEATKNDTSGEKVSTWQMTVGWNRLENDFYIYPFTVKQYTGLFHGEVAFFSTNPPT